ncbi:MAG: M24 family metallopeptidase [Candidatus Lokiarchaeota archaeon]|nr:M24 family metallopeptidase [Candidatus Lokiarchaeota archaeon]MBD3200480.1 M24 family metallopeptidase [Candidatus Lokiarchaeota archaeon]
MSEIKIDWKGHVKKYQAAMEELNLDFCVLTRVKSITYLAGCFVPWKSTILLPRQGEGEPILFTVLLDVERVKEEGKLETQGWGPMKGFEWQKKIKKAAKKMGAYNPKGDGPRIGVELGLDICVTGQMLTFTEANLLKKVFPGCKLIDFNPKTEEIQLIKEPEEIAMLRKASEITDVGQTAVKEVFMQREDGKIFTENEIAGIGTLAMRKAGSNYEWTFTGNEEIGSGYRASWTFNGCTPATNKKVLEGESLLVDLHSEYGCYLGDLSHNYILGSCPKELKEFNDVYEQLCYTLLDNMKPGISFNECYQEVRKVADKSGYANDLFFGLGHGIGCIGNESYPIVLPGKDWGEMTFKENMVEIAAVVFNRPGLGGLRLEAPTLVTKNKAEMLPKTPIEVDYV